MAYKEAQLHNHAVLITSAIAMLGFLLQDSAIQHAGLEGEYGLLDQLERGTLPDGFWYEGAFSYHFYCMYPLIQYSLLAEGTEWDLRANRKLRQMFDFPLSFILLDGTHPSINDTSSPGSIQTYARYYEIALAWYGDDRYRQLLRFAYGMESEGSSHLSRDAFMPAKRHSFDVLLFGQSLEGVNGAKRQLQTLLDSSASSASSGLTKLVNGRGWHLLVKHNPLGGEHDHMERLGLSFGCVDKPLAADPGTTSYAVPAHYDWFKHTYSHNTISVNGQDQPPADGRLIQFNVERWGSWVESAVDWGDGFYLMRGHIRLPEQLSPWDEASYRQVSIRRINVLTEHAMLDIVKVTTAEVKEMDLLYHMSGELTADPDWEWTDLKLSSLSPHLFHNRRSEQLRPGEQLAWTMKQGIVRHACWCSAPATLISARTLNNPPNAFRESIIERAEGSGEMVFVNAFNYDEDEVQSNFAMIVAELEGGYRLELSAAGSTSCYELKWGSEDEGSLLVATPL